MTLAATAAFILLFGAAFSYNLFFGMETLDPATLEFKHIEAPYPLIDDCTRIQKDLDHSSRKLVKNTAPLSADEIKIYQMILQHWSSNGRDSVNLSQETYPFDSDFSHLQCECLSGIDAQLYAEASHSFHILHKNVLPSKGVRLVDQKIQASSVKSNDPDNRLQTGKSLDDAVHDAFDNGLFSLSEIVFDTAHGRALVSYSFVCGALCGNGGTWLFEKVDGEWKKSNRTCGGWMS